MAPASGLPEYTRRMHRVLAYIDEHLEETLDLPTLAQVANFSAFHFHRVFAAWMGETLGDYLRRRRLETAALRLIAQPDVPVLSIALSVGFGSTEAFARAFKTRFSCTPSAWRKQQAQRRTGAPGSNPDQFKRNPDQVAARRPGHHEDSSQRLVENHMKVKIIDRPAVTIAYLRRTGPYGPGVSEFWRDTVYPWMVTNNLLGAPRYGISHDDPGITAPDKCRYDAAVEVAPGFAPSGKALTATVPGGKYAVTRFRGKVEELGESWDGMLRDWLPTSGMQLDARPFFEYYPPDASYDPVTGVFECDVCIPVAAL